MLKWWWIVLSLKLFQTPHVNRATWSVFFFDDWTNPKNCNCATARMKRAWMTGLISSWSSSFSYNKKYIFSMNWESSRRTFLFAYLHHDRIKRDHPVVKVYEPSAFRVKLVRNANVRHRRRNRTLTIHDTALTVKIRRRICQREAYSDPRDRLNLTPNPWNNVPISGHLTTGVRDFMEWNGRRRFQMRCKIRVHPGSNFGTNFIKFRDWTWLFCRCLQLLQNEKKN